MAREAPRIDTRTAAEIVEAVEARIHAATGWQRPADGELDAGGALIRIFGRFAELVIERLNVLPDKNFLAFLDLIGTRLEPPQPARVPLTFQLAEGSPVDALVPAATPVAATALEGEEQAPVFETERALVVTRSRLVAAVTREPERDRFSLHPPVADGPPVEPPFAVFTGETPIAHRLYLGHAELLSLAESKTVTLRFFPAAAAPPEVVWELWDGAAWQPVDAAGELEVLPDGQQIWKVTLSEVPAVPVVSAAAMLAEDFESAALAELAEVESAWLRGRLVTSLPRGSVEDDPAGGRVLVRAGLELTARVPGSAGPTAVDLSRPFAPFGETPPPTLFFLAVGEELTKPGAEVEIAVTIDTARPTLPSEDLTLAWEYLAGSGAWQPLPVADDTAGFTRDGTVGFTAPATWPVVEVDGVAGLWLRAGVATGNYGDADEYHPPFLARLDLSYRWSLPRILGARVEAHTECRDLLPELAFNDQVPIDLGKDFLPFGEKPAFSSAFFLRSTEAFARSSARVSLAVELANPRRSQASWAIPPVAASEDLEIVWETWNGERWSALGTGTPLPFDRLVEPVATPFTSDSLTLSGRRSASATVTVNEFPHGLATTVDAGSEIWEMTLSGLAAGFHLLLIELSERQQVSHRQWLVTFRAAPGVEPPAALVLEVPRITDAAAVTLRGRFERPPRVPAGLVTVVKAADSGTTTVPLAADGTFEVPDIPLDLGRNDLLVVIAADSGDQPGIIFREGAAVPVAGEVVSVLRQAERLAEGDFRDETFAFTRGGTVSFTVPDGASPTDQVDGEPGHWLRARILRGHYGVETRYEPVLDASGNPVPHEGTAIPIFQLTPATFRPPAVSTLRLACTWDSELRDGEPDLLLAENDFVLTASPDGAPLFPFTPAVDARPTLYLGFARPGDAVGFANRTTALYFGVAEPLFERSAATVAAGEEPVVVWEYWDGLEWERLGTRDETSGLRQRGLLTFIGPPDFRASADFGRLAFWLRGRFELGAYPVPPRIARILTNTTWATHVETLADEVLGSSRGEPEQLLRTTRTPVLAGQELQVREPEVPSAAELEALAEEEGADAVSTVLDETGRPLEIWVRWHEVPDFFTSDPRDRHYTLDRLTGEVRFGDGRRGLVPPPGRGNVRLRRYRTGGGLSGNREAANVNQLKGAVPYVDGVVNHEPAAGGAARESLDALRVRGPKTLRHRDRAVALADFEDLAFQASTRVARVRGMPAPASDPGSVGLIIVPQGTEARPVPSLELLDRVRDAIEARLLPTVDVWLAGPDWLCITVTAEVVPEHLEEATDVHNVLLEQLAAFLHPLTGAEGEGWAFGRKPQPSDLYALIEAQPGVDHVRFLAVDEEAVEGDARPDRFLVFSGSHQITMIGSTDEESAS